jgi:undecaprenyl diphosphate synthase
VHVAIIMHGNRQWAMQRGLSSTACHAAGAAALHTTVALAASVRVRTLTLYSICGPCRGGPAQEANADLCVLHRFLGSDLQWCLENFVRVSLIGSCGRLSWLRPTLADHQERLDVARSRLHLRIVVDYSSHDNITKAAWRNNDCEAPEQFNRELCRIDPTALPAGAVDLLVRTGGGSCRSDFMLWEVAYARQHFVNRLWPDFTAGDLKEALNAHSRNLRCLG